MRFVVESSETAIVKPGEPNAAAVPLATTEPEQSVVAYSLTVEEAAALPEIAGALSFAGGAGVESSDAGEAGAVESST